MSDKTMPITGGCMCGAVRYEATDPPQKVGYCHGLVAHETRS